MAVQGRIVNIAAGESHRVQGRGKIIITLEEIISEIFYSFLTVQEAKKSLGYERRKLF